MRITVTRRQLISFLNSKDLVGKVEPQMKEAQATLRECVELIRTYRAKWMSDRYKSRRLRLAQDLYRNVMARLQPLLGQSRLEVYPAAINEDLWRKEQPTWASMSDWIFKPYASPPDGTEPEELHRVFSPGGVTIRGDQPSGNYALAFIDLLCDEKVGIFRILRCLWCGEFAIGRPDQTYCSNRCRSRHHNSLRSREDNRAAVLKCRKEVKEQELRLKEKGNK